jgi:hypothetical protein
MINARIRRVLNLTLPYKKDFFRGSFLGLSLPSFTRKEFFGIGFVKDYKREKSWS